MWSTKKSRYISTLIKQLYKTTANLFFNKEIHSIVTLRKLFSMSFQMLSWWFNLPRHFNVIQYLWSRFRFIPCYNTTRKSQEKVTFFPMLIRTKKGLIVDNKIAIWIKYLNMRKSFHPIHCRNAILPSHENKCLSFKLFFGKAIPPKCSVIFVMRKRHILHKFC